MQENYFIYVNGVRIPVSEEVYREIKRADWREEKQEAAREGREVSLDAITGAGITLPADEKLVEDIVLDRAILNVLNAALDALPDDERRLIDALFCQEISETKVARNMRVPRTTLIDQKNKILDKLRKYIN